MAEKHDEDSAIYNPPLDLDIQRPGRVIIYEVEEDTIIQEHTDDGIIEHRVGYDNFDEYSMDELVEIRSVLVPRDATVHSVVEVNRK